MLENANFGSKKCCRNELSSLNSTKSTVSVSVFVRNLPFASEASERVCVVVGVEGWRGRVALFFFGFSGLVVERRKCGG